MTAVINLLLLPLRAPMLLLLLAVSTYLGLHWSHDQALQLATGAELPHLPVLVWSAQCLQAVVVVVVCTIPDLLLRQISTLMATSRVISLVVTLLLMITGGLYLLHLDVLSSVLILASAVLLARLDLLRLRVVPPPLLMALVFAVLVLGGLSAGRLLGAHLGEPQLVPSAPIQDKADPSGLRAAQQPPG